MPRNVWTDPRECPYEHTHDSLRKREKSPAIAAAIAARAVVH